MFLYVGFSWLTALGRRNGYHKPRSKLPKKVFWWIWRAGKGMLLLQKIGWSGKNYHWSQRAKLQSCPARPCRYVCARRPRRHLWRILSAAKHWHVNLTLHGIQVSMTSLAWHMWAKLSFFLPVVTWTVFIWVKKATNFLQRYGNNSSIYWIFCSNQRYQCSTYGIWCTWLAGKKKPTSHSMKTILSYAVPRIKALWQINVLHGRIYWFYLYTSVKYTLEELRNIDWTKRRFRHPWTVMMNRDMF